MVTLPVPRERVPTIGGSPVTTMPPPLVELVCWKLWLNRIELLLMLPLRL